MVHGRRLNLYRQSYGWARAGFPFRGGLEASSCWVDKESLLARLEAVGFRLTIGETQLDHQNGPCLRLYGEQRPSS